MFFLFLFCNIEYLLGYFHALILCVNVASKITEGAEKGSTKDEWMDTWLNGQMNEQMNGKVIDVGRKGLSVLLVVAS